MNQVIIEGSLTKAAYTADKGWSACTLAVSKAGTDYKLWVSVYAPAGAAGDALRGAQQNEIFRVEGSLDEGKDKEGKKYIQVKASKVSRAKSAADRAYDNTGITDDDIPF